MNWAIKIFSKTLMTKISCISWGGYDKGGYDKGGYDKVFYGNNLVFPEFDKEKVAHIEQVTLRVNDHPEQS